MSEYNYDAHIAEVESTYTSLKDCCAKLKSLFLIHVKFIQEDDEKIYTSTDQSYEQYKKIAELLTLFEGHFSDEIMMILDREE